MGNLMRSRTNRMIGGVAAGLARQNYWDPSVVRILWAVLALFGGTGVLLYIIMWVVVPEEPLGLPSYTGYAPTPQYPSAASPQTYGAPPQPYPAPQQAYPPANEPPRA